MYSSFGLFVLGAACGLAAFWIVMTVVAFVFEICWGDKNCWNKRQRQIKKALSTGLCVGLALSILPWLAGSLCALSAVLSFLGISVYLAFKE